MASESVGWPQGGVGRPKGGVGWPWGGVVWPWEGQMAWGVKSEGNQGNFIKETGIARTRIGFLALLEYENTSPRHGLSRIT